MSRNGVRTKQLTRQSRQYTEASRRWREALKRTGYVECHLCNRPIDLDALANHPDSLEVDHIIPLNRGGSLMDQSGWAPAHKSCNSGKRDSLTFEVLTVRSVREW